MDTITNQKIFFEFDRYDIRADSQEVLKAKANALRSYPSIRIQIQGNCDERGTQEYNLALGERRARAAYEFLLRLGVPAEQMEMISFGKERPAVTGTGEAVWAQNRRDEFVITGYYAGTRFCKRPLSQRERGLFRFQTRNLEHFTLEMPCKNLSSNPCSQMIAGRQSLPLGKRLRR